MSDEDVTDEFLEPEDDADLAAVDLAVLVNTDLADLEFDQWDSDD